MRKACFLAIVLGLSTLTISAQAELYGKLLFDGTPVAGAATYTAGPGDVVTSFSLVRSYPWPAGVTQPVLAGHDIVTPATAGPQGGNVMQGNTTATKRMGLFVTLNPPITGSWTVESYMLTTDLNPGFTEYKIQDIMQGWWINSSNTRFEVRHFGNEGGIGNNVVNLSGGDPKGTGEIQANSTSNLIVANQWHHLALVFDQPTNTMKLYLDGNATPIVQINPQHAFDTPQLGNVVLGAWANDAGNCRDLSGSIDAFAVSNAALAPGSFALVTPASVQDWQMYK